MLKVVVIVLKMHFCEPEVIVCNRREKESYKHSKIKLDPQANAHTLGENRVKNQYIQLLRKKVQRTGKMGIQKLEYLISISTFFLRDAICTCY